MNTTTRLVHYLSDDTWSLVVPVYENATRNFSIPRVVGRDWATVLPVHEEPTAFGSYPWASVDAAIELVEMVRKVLK